jgi:hypothetical protein
MDSVPACGVRCLRSSVDTGDREPAKLSLEEVPLNALG